ncbi:hypothetical protein [Tahibacter amnicola]|uniref:Uncharacterized protein n=1 Tax=Tahibacter amnicola TaxID=2976241 RepID=A0ABY6B9S2_9GAMM|nr:hypothetical protein [Tahibacter amnicola]UXI66818.1 hypothetical protein N4264_18970 [Tahibacter amnicola]
MRPLRRFSAVVLVLLIAWLAVQWLQLLPRVTDEQRRQIAALSYTPGNVDDPGNAYAALWTIQYAVDTTEALSVARTDVAQVMREHTQGRAITLSGARVAGQEPEKLDDAEKASLCGDRKVGCLGFVREHRDAARQTLQAHSAYLARIAALATYTSWRNPMPAAVDAPLPLVPAGEIRRLALSAAALDFVEGRHAEGLDAVCRFAATWRRLRDDTDALIVDMLGTAFVAASARLFADMLAELPTTAEMPAACGAAFTPLQDAELEQCDEIRAEFAMMSDAVLDAERGVYSDTPAWGERIARRFMNRQHVIAHMAPSYFQWCDVRHQQRLRERRPATAGVPAGCSLGEKVFNPVGCVIIGIAPPDFSRYYGRVLDLDALLRATSTLLWLRRQPGDAASRLHERPAELRDTTGTLKWRDSYLEVTMATLLEGDEVVRLPMPGSRLAAAVPSAVAPEPVSRPVH